MENDGVRVLFITEGSEKPFLIRWHLSGDLEARQMPEESGGGCSKGMCLQAEVL